MKLHVHTLNNFRFPVFISISLILDLHNIEIIVLPLNDRVWKRLTKQGVDTEGPVIILSSY